MIEPNIDMLYRFLFVYLIIHIVAFVYDVIRRRKFWHYNNKYYWMKASATSTLLYLDLFLCAAVVALFVVEYILTGDSL
jgi:hypothetical protein